MSITELRPALTLIVADYVTQRHVCDQVDFDPAECVPCIGCNHGECRHRSTDMPKPIDTTGMTPTQKADALRVEVYTLHAAITATPCEVAGCPCSRMKCGDECTVCGGEGNVEDPRTGNTYTCVPCRGYGVIS